MAQTAKMVFIDVITENAGIDPSTETGRVVSVQLLDGGKQEVYYAESYDGDHSLFGAALQIKMFSTRGYTFAGYGVRQFELPALKRFLNIMIPGYMTVDLAESELLVKLRESTKKPLATLDDVCLELGVSLEYRRGIDDIAALAKKRPEVLAKADSAAQQLSSSKGWPLDVSRQYALDRIAAGTAVAESYAEFVEKRGSQDTAFYRYAAGQVVCEHSILQALQNPARPQPWSLRSQA
jgi:hypothetical protein